ncbi:uncharacterized protein [Branchiostoma lanceolatum]
MVRVTLESGGAQDPLPPGKVNWKGENGPGGFCSIKVNKVEQAVMSIGFNIVVLKTPDQDRPEQSSSFDTCRDPEACNALVDFIRHIQPDRYVLMTACGSITDCLSEPLCDELRKLGSGYFATSMDQLSGAHRNESWVMAARKGHELIKECFKAAGAGPCVETLDI